MRGNAQHAHHHHHTHNQFSANSTGGSSVYNSPMTSNISNATSNSSGGQIANEKNGANNYYNRKIARQTSRRH